MAANKTRPTGRSVERFLNGIGDQGQQADCQVIVSLMKELTGADPEMWGDSIVGFGKYQYQYASGRKGEWFLTGFSPRKQNLTVYIMGYLERYPEILADLGKFSHGKGCLYIRRLEDIDLDVLKNLIIKSIDKLKDSTQP